MKLVAYQVVNFKNIYDSGWLELSDLTILTGPNESGKSALMQALYYLNPLDATVPDIQLNWPREARSQMDAKTNFLHAKFELSPAQIEAVAAAGKFETPLRAVYITQSWNGTLAIHDSFVSSDAGDGSSPSEQTDIAKELLTMLRSKQEFSELFETSRIEVISQIQEIAADKKILQLDDVKHILGLLEPLRDKAMYGNEFAFHNGLTDFLNGVLRTLQPLEHKIPKAIDKMIREWLPKCIFLHQASQRFLGGTFNLPEVYKALNNGTATESELCFEMLLQLADLSIEGEIERLKNNSLEQRVFDFDEAAVRFNAVLQNFWQQSKYAFEFQPDGDNLSIFVLEKGDNITKRLDEHSDGFRYFFATILNLTFIAKNYSDAILLIDEPSAYLHPSLQIELSAILKRFSAPTRRVIYTAHSHLMLNTADTRNVWQVKHENQRQGAAISKIYDINELYSLFALDGLIQKIREEATVRIEFPPGILFVDNIVDYWVLTALNMVMKHNDLPALEPNCVIVPSADISSRIDNVAKYNLRLVNTPEEDDDGLAIFYGEFINRVETTEVEDLLTPHFLLDFVNLAYESELAFQPISPSQLESGDGPIIQSLETTLRKLANNSSLKLERERYARLLFTQIIGGNVSYVPDETVQNFSALFDRINEKLKSLSAGS